MPKNPVSHSEGLYDYMLSVSVRETEEQTMLRKITGKLELSVMQISPDQGMFMAMLVRLIGARQVIEVGTFTGYSALTMALALPDDGRLITCDISTEWTDVGRPFWEQGGVDRKIDLRIGPATDTLDQLIKESSAQDRENQFDMVFIDADKANYVNYYEKALRLIRTGGLIVVDNVFWGGAVADHSDTREDTLSIRELNQLITSDQRVDISMIAVGDGLFLARKK